MGVRDTAQSERSGPPPGEKRYRNKNSGKLFCDADGNGKDEAIAVAIISTNTNLVAGHWLFCNDVADYPKGGVGEEQAL